MMINSDCCHQDSVLLRARPALASLVLLLFLQACSPSDNDPVNENPREGVFDDQIDTLDKAKSVEQQLKDSADAQRRSIEEQGG